MKFISCHPQAVPDGDWIIKRYGGDEGKPASSFFYSDLTEINRPTSMLKSGGFLIDCLSKRLSTAGLWPAAPFYPADSSMIASVLNPFWQVSGRRFTNSIKKCSFLTRTSQTAGFTSTSGA